MQIADPPFALVDKLRRIKGLHLISGEGAEIPWGGPKLSWGGAAAPPSPTQMTPLPIRFKFDMLPYYTTTVSRNILNRNRIYDRAKFLITGLGKIFIDGRRLPYEGSYTRSITPIGFKFGL